MALVSGPADDIEPRLDTVEFLARSPNRVLVLGELASSPKTRPEIMETTGFSRATLSRTLTEFIDRGWVTASEDRFELTVLGGFVADEFNKLLDRMAVVQDLREVVRWFPERGYGFDLSLFNSADIVRPSKEDALAPTNNLVRRIEAADHVQILSYSMLPDTLQACWRNVRDDRRTVELVLETPVLDAINSHPPMTSQFRDLLSSETASVYEYKGDLPYVVIIADHVVNLCLSDDDGAPHAMVDTKDSEIHQWAQSTFESYRSESVPINAGKSPS